MKAIDQQFASLADLYELFASHTSIRSLHLYQKLGYYEFKRIKMNDSLILILIEKYVNMKEILVDYAYGTFFIHQALHKWKNRWVFF
jgi:hypothetical protein